MAKYTVIWRDNGDEFMVTTVEMADEVDPQQVDNNDWADLAHLAECNANGIPLDESEFSAARDGYDLITVIKGVPDFVY
jgi:hypothetical protein